MSLPWQWIRCEPEFFRRCFLLTWLGGLGTFLIVGTDEVYRAMKTNRTGLRAIQEAKMGDKFKVAMDSAAQVDQSPIAGAVHNGVSPAVQSTTSPLNLPATTEGPVFEKALFCLHCHLRALGHAFRSIPL